MLRKDCENNWPTAVDYNEVLVKATPPLSPAVHSDEAALAIENNMINEASYNDLFDRNVMLVDSIDCIAEYFFVAEVCRRTQIEYIDQFSASSEASRTMQSAIKKVEHCKSLLCQVDYADIVLRNNSNYQLYYGEILEKEQRILDEMWHLIQRQAIARHDALRFECLYKHWCSKLRRICNRYELATRKSTFYKL